MTFKVLVLLLGAPTTEAVGCYCRADGNGGGCQANNGCQCATTQSQWYGVRLELT